MTIVRVQSGNQQGTVTAASGLASGGFISNVTAGNTLILAAAYQGTASSTGAVTDALGNTYHQAGTYLYTSGNAVYIALWYAFNVTGGGLDSITWKPSSNGQGAIIYLEYSGLTTTDPYAANAQTTTGAGGGSLTTPTVTVNGGNGGDLLLGVGSVALDTSTFTAGSGFAVITSVNSDGTKISLAVEEKLGVSANQTVVLSFSGTPAASSLIGLSFKAAPAPVSAPRHTVFLPRFEPALLECRRLAQRGRRRWPFRLPWLPRGWQPEPAPAYCRANQRRRRRAAAMS